MSKRKISFIFLVVAAIILCVVLSNPKTFLTKEVEMAMAASSQDNTRVYECDYKTISLRTAIEFEKDGSRYEIRGQVLTFLTDPLTLYKDGDKYGQADDTFHLIGQDDHAIVINGKTEIIMTGEFKFFGNEYTLYSNDGSLVGKAEFGPMCRSGAVYEGEKVVAVFTRSLFRNDYTVTVYDNDLCSDEAILMLVGSYVSDYHADSSSSSSNSNSN